MKLKDIIAIILAGSLALGGNALGEILKLRDGSVLKNVRIVNESLEFQTNFGKRKIKTDSIGRIDLSKEQEGQDSVYLIDGTVLENVELVNGAVCVESGLLGKINIPEERISEIDFERKIAERGIIKPKEELEYFILEGKIYSKTKEGKNIKIVADDCRYYDYHGGYRKNNIRISPDGTKLLCPGIKDDKFFIVIMDMDGGNKKFILPHRNFSNMGSEENQVYSLAWAPDGKKLVVSTNTFHKGSNLEIYVCDLNGENVERLTATPEHERVEKWSKEGIIYSLHRSSAYRYEKIGTFIISPEGGNPRPYRE